MAQQRLSLPGRNGLKSVNCPMDSTKTEDAPRSTGGAVCVDVLTRPAHNSGIRPGRSSGWRRISNSHRPADPQAVLRAKITHGFVFVAEAHLGHHARMRVLLQARHLATCSAVSAASKSCPCNGERSCRALAPDGTQVTIFCQPTDNFKPRRAYRPSNEGAYTSKR
jgi:hypothetical protein